MNSSGTWGESITNLFPNMTEAGVEKVISIYFERHLFPGITDASNAKHVESTIDIALQYMTEDAKIKVINILDEFY